MRTASAPQPAPKDDALGEDILQHVTPKWVDWYRENARNQSGETDHERGEAAKAQAKVKNAGGDAER